jgi:hypothetical protein
LARVEMKPIKKLACLAGLCWTELMNEERARGSLLKNNKIIWPSHDASTQRHVFET